MSKQVTDSINRMLQSCVQECSKDNYEKALELADKALQKALNKKEAGMFHSCLVMKGNLLEMMSEEEEALDAYDEAFQVSYTLFLKFSDNEQVQEDLIESLEFIVALHEGSEDPLQAEMVCEANKTSFEDILRIYSDLFSSKGPDILSNYVRTASVILLCYFTFDEALEHKELVLETIDKFEQLLELDPEDNFPVERAYDVVKGYSRICMENEAIEEAIEFMVRIRDMFERYGSGSVNVILDQIRVSEFLSMCHTLLDEKDRARENSEKASKLRENLFQQHPDDPEVPLFVANAYLSIGELYMENSAVHIPDSSFNQALETAERVFGLDFQDHVDAYIILFENISSAFGLADDPENRIRCYQDEIKLCEVMLEKELYDLEDLYLSIATSTHNIANVHYDMMDREQAQTYFEQEISVYEKLVELYPDNMEYRFSITEILNSLGFIFIDTDEKKSAEFFNRALEIHDEVLTLKGVESERDYVDTLKGLGVLNKSAGDYDKALLLLDRAVNIVEKNLEDDTGDAEYQLNLFRLYRYLAETHYEMDEQKVLAERLFAKSLSVHSRILDNLGFLNYIGPAMVESIIHDGKNYITEGKPAFASLCFNFALEYCEKEFEKETISPEIVSPSIDVLLNIFHFALRSSMTDQAVRMHERFFSLLDKALEYVFDDIDLLEDASRTYSVFGTCCMEENELDLAQEAFERSIKLLEEFKKESDGHEYSFVDEINTLDSYCKVLSKKGLEEAAGIWQALLDEKKQEYEQWREQFS